MLDGNLHTLIPLDDFKAVLGIDDREDKLSRFCLVTSTFTIEQYCKRRLLRKKHFEHLEYIGDLLLPLREYPVVKMLAAYLIANNSEQVTGNKGKREMNREQIGEILEPEFYSVVPDCGSDEDIPFCLSLSPALKRYRGITAIKAIYQAGYSVGDVPPDLATACLELASWNMNRYRGRRVGMTGNVRGGGKEGEHFEMSMPENVKALLEPYRRKTI
jgi:hypothetical protein